jgi:hypothetical protein
MKTTLLLFFITIFAFGQDINIDIKKSEIFKDKKRHTDLLFSESDGEGGLIVVRTVHSGFKFFPKEFNIEHYDSALNRVDTQVIDNKGDTSIDGILVKDGVINLIQFNEEKRKKIFRISVLSSPISRLNFTKKELFKITHNEYSASFGFRRAYDNFGDIITFSKKKKYMVFSFDVNNKKKETHLFRVFDDNFKEVYKTTFIRDIKDRLFEYDNIDLSDVDGSIFLLGKVFENNSKKIKKKGKTNYHFELFKLNNGINKQINLKEDSHFVSSFHVLHTTNNLNLVGFYSDKTDNRFKGVCRYNLDPNELTISSKSFAPFSDQFFNDKYKKGAKIKAKKKEIKHLAFRGVFLDDNDNIIINAEEFFIVSHYYSNPNGGGSYSTTYHFNDIISVKIDAKGKLVWARNINKKQIGLLNASYTSTVFNHNVYFFINASDNIKKLSNERIAFKHVKSKKSNLYVITINENGVLNYKKLIDDKEAKVWYRVNDGVVSEDLNSVILQGFRKKNKQIIKLNIN